ncbi:hypothetical protein [Anabaena sp. AL09]|jgi:hypothetical protein|uniref:hypothetical protein n=1 Tax=Anabaena sp. AL09 TaxID=1710891 RepID=UPI000A776599|nr:hypothetical protein [Anabaena sp. AL09]
MNTGCRKFFELLFSNRFPIIKWVVTLVLVVNLSSCAEAANSQEISINPFMKAPPTSEISGTFSETAPPNVIQALRPSLEGYQPQVSILSPQVDEILQDNIVKVRLQVKDLPIFKDPQWQLGPHLHLILDNQPYIAVYDVNQPVVLSDLSPGTHTLRVFASRPWHESFKNEGAYTQTTFHVLTKTEENNPDSKLPLLTYSRPNGGYGAEPIMLDFYLTNAPLHSLAETNPEDTMSNWRIRSTVNGESFILDRWQPIYLKGFKPGKTWVKLEFLDNQGQPVKNAFNTSIRLINYQPNGQDTLSKIVRGELTADEVRGIVDPTYTAKIPATEATPTPATKVEKQPIPEVKVPEVKVPEVTPTPATKVEKQPIPEVKVPEVKVPEVTTIPATKVEKQPVPEVKIPEVKSTPVASPPVAAEAKVTETEESNLPSETMENPKSQFQE